jgi:hypothetical protein
MKMNEAEWVKLLKDIRTNNAPHVLDLSNQELNDNDLKILAVALEDNSVITELDLRGNLLTDAGVMHLLAMMDFNSSLIKLHLESNNNINNNTMVMACELIAMPERQPANRLRRMFFANTNTTTNSQFPFQIIKGKDLKQRGVLGDGAKGFVYLGTWREDKKEDKKVAIKTLVPPHVLADRYHALIYAAAARGNNSLVSAPDIESKEQVEDLLNEAKLIASLHSPYIVQLHGVALSSSPKLVMEYSPGGNLYNRLHNDNKPFEWSKRVRIALDTGEAVLYLHTQQPFIVHCDIKSPNIVLDLNDRAKLTDFGSAAELLNRNTSHTTLQWAAPELLFDGIDRYSTASDIYALGVVLWELVSRYAPFAHLRRETIPYMITGGERPAVFPPETPSNYTALLKRCWAERRDLRPQAKEVVNKLKMIAPSSETNSEISTATSSTNCKV